MKHLSAYKSMCLLIALLLTNSLCIAQQTKWTDKNANELYNSYALAIGPKIKAHTPADVIAFAKQYETNKAAWDKAAAFIHDRNLQMMAPGKYPIDGDNVYAIITEGAPKQLDTAGWEGHRKYADLHYVIKGKEKIGVVTVDVLKVTKPYDETKDVENYYTNGKFYTATPNNFFIFLPGDIHQANMSAGGNSPVKKLVIKIRVVK
jgi:biofilm protein TabA